MQRLFITLLTLLSKISGKQVLYINRRKLDPSRFATFTDYGFWFCGNVFDYSDIAYGFADSGKIESGEMDTVRSIIKTSSKNPYIFYDIGSNTGPYSLLAASTTSNCIIHSFDPVPEHLRILRHSIRLNSLEDRVSLHEVALSNRTGTAKLTLSGTGSSLEEGFLTRKPKPTIEVAVSDLDSYAEEHNLEDPHFIKIDVEGHEMQAVEGASAMIERACPILFIEVARHLTDSGRSFHNDHYGTFFEFFHKKGYEAFKFEGGKFVPFSALFNTPGAHMYLFLHKKAHFDVKQCLKV